MITWLSNDPTLNNAYGKQSAEQWKATTLDLVKQYYESLEQAELPIYPKTRDTSKLEKAETMKDVMLEVSNILDVEFEAYDDMSQPYMDTKKIRQGKENYRYLESELEDLEEAYKQYQEGNTDAWFDYLTENMGEQYRVSIDGTGSLSYDSVMITLAIGGPGIWLDTETGTLILKWWSEKAEIGVSKDICDLVDEFFEEKYEMLSRR